jgi:LPXTG-motif cell wall-anchored protein
MKLSKRISAAVIAVMAAASLCMPTSGAFADPGPMPTGPFKLVVHGSTYWSDWLTPDPGKTSTGEVIPDTEVIGVWAPHPNVPITLGGLGGSQGMEFKIIERKAWTVNPATGQTELQSDPAWSPVTVPTDANGVAEFSNLPEGYYLVTEILNSSRQIETIAPFWVQLPMAKQDNSAWLSEVHVYAKDQLDEVIEKNVSGLGFIPPNHYPQGFDCVTNGKDATYFIKTIIPRDIATCARYDIVDDQMPDVVHFVPGRNSVNVSYTDYATGNQVDLIGTPGVNGTPGPNDDYYVVHRSGAAQYPWDDGITVKLTAKGMASIAAALSPNDYFNKPRLTTTISTKVDVPQSQIEAAINQGWVNKAQLDFIRDANYHFIYESNDCTITMGGFIIQKTDAQGNLLDGAEFLLYESEQDALARQNPVLDANGQPLTGTSPIPGYIEFFGIPDRDYNHIYGGTFYWLVETKAPAGYNLCPSPVEVYFDYYSHQKDPNTGIALYPIEIVNEKIELPITGGQGTLVFLAVGGGLLAAGLVALALMRRRAKKLEEQEG